MGNQIVCPSGQHWYLSDFQKMGISIDHSIYDGTFLLSFKAEELKFPRRSVVVKAYKIPNISEIDEQTYNEINNVIQMSKSFFTQLKKANIPGIVANESHIYGEGAYLVRPYYSQSLQIKMNDFPELTNYEKDWISYQILRNIQNLHEHGLFHGDIKPENILLTDRLQVQIVDEAPFKPIFLKNSQPNFFFHYFSYFGGSCFLAPERVCDESGIPLGQLQLSKCDLFSTGCLLAYIYLNGKALFNFTTIQEYQQNNEKEHFLKPLNSIKNDKIRNLIIKLLDVSPNNRNLNDIEDVFPKWFKQFYDLFYEQRIDTMFMEKLLTVHDEIMNILPENESEGSLIYFNILSDVILSSGRLVSLKTLIDHYVNLTTKYFDKTQKLSKAVPILFEIFERRNNIASIYAFDGISRILDSIDKVPNEFINYPSAFLLPRLSEVLIDGWAAVFICTLPQWAYSIHKIWPSFYADLRSDVSICQYIFSINSLIITTNIPNQSEMGIIRGYLKKCKEAIQYKSFELLSTLCFFMFPLLSSSLFLPEIITIICTFYEHFDNFSKTQFHETLEDPLFTSIFANEFTEKQAPEILCSFLELLNIPMKEIYITQLINVTLHWANSKIPEIKGFVREIFLRLPEKYQQISIVQSLKTIPEKSHSQTIIKTDLSEQQQNDSLEIPLKPLMHGKRAHSTMNVSHILNETQSFISNTFSTILPNQITNSQPTSPTKSNSSSNLNSSLINPTQNSSSDIEIITKFIHCMKLTDKPIDKIFFINKETILIFYNKTTLSFYKIDYKAPSLLTDIRHLVHDNEITCIEMISDSVFCFSDIQNKVYYYNFIEHQQKLQLTTKIPISSIVALDKENLCFIYRNSPTIDFRRIEDLSQLCVLNCGNYPIKIIKNIEGTPFILSCDYNNNISVIDRRVNLPLFNLPLLILNRGNQQNKEQSENLSIFDIIPFYITNNTTQTNETIVGIILEEQIIVYNINQKNILLIINGSFQKAYGNQNNLIIPGQNGTFLVNIFNPTEIAFNLYDKSIITSLSPNIKIENDIVVIDLPQKLVKSLHSHLFPTTAIDSFETFFVSGDSSGFFNLWFYKFKDM